MPSKWGRGHGSQADRAAGSSLEGTEYQDAESQASSENLYPCDTCNTNIRNIDFLECELYSIWTNASQERSGLLYKVFRNIVDYSNSGNILDLVLTSEHDRVSRLDSTAPSPGCGHGGYYDDHRRYLGASARKHEHRVSFC
ncbi:hypothetical protein E2C01_031220 [Portunus trituberculatus]|uniref:Uncharacterized protein n=1 Tax=Portunus trituberculatus TaxID=210409 RepID=A0A5B7ESF6_PORTR|nr:hypothetical protein [Portunus trituberculatus]